MKDEIKKGLCRIFALYLICEIVKDFEFLVLKTDQTFLAENILCKFFAIGVIQLYLNKRKLTWSHIGFKKTGCPLGIISGAVLGFSLGIVTFTISYFTEYVILCHMGLRPKLSLYISNFSISNQNITGISLTALVLCLFGNLINVWAEEGLFRGLIFQIGKETLASGATRRTSTLRTANLIQAAFFGVWHVIVVVVWLADGSIDLPTAFLTAVGYVILAGILGYEWGLCAALTGTLWAGFFEHFFNNFISNFLHVVTETGVDELQILRIVLSNLLSLLLVLILTKYKKVGEIKI